MDQREIRNSILSRWDVVSQERAHHVAVWLPDGKPVCTFEELRERGHKWAERLRRQEGWLVVVRARNSAGWIAALLGIWEANKVALLLDYQVPIESLDESFADLAGALVIEEGADRRLVLRNRLPSGRRLISSVATAVRFAKATTDEFVDDKFLKVDLIKLTSGTSGKPRAVLFTAAELEADCDHICQTMGIRAADCNYGLTAFSHSYGFSNLVTPLLCYGISVVVASDAFPEAILRGLKVTRATIFPSVPVVLRALSNMDSCELRDLRFCISAGAPLTPDVAKRFFERYGRRIHGFYGASECGGICYDREGLVDFALGFVGEPLDGVTIVRVDGEPGKESRIVVQSDAVAVGYWPPKLDDDIISAKQFSPSDLLLRKDEGWYVVGRESEKINVAGRKANPIEIQEVLCRHESVKEAVVLGIASALRGEEIIACIVAYEPVSKDALRAHCAERLASWMIPKQFIFINAIPVNSRGKVNRQELLKRIESGSVR